MRLLLTCLLTLLLVACTGSRSASGGIAPRVLLVDAYQGDSNAGYHDGVRTAWVATPDGWSEILSHECIEMLLGNICDPVQRPYGSPPVENFQLPAGGDYLTNGGQ